jgi:mRNA interferase MazF
MTVHKWDVWVADLNPRRGTEPGKMRPVLIVQTDLLNSVHPSTIICPLTTRINLHSKLLRVHLKKGVAGLTKESDVMIDQVRAIDNRRLLKRLGSIDASARVAVAHNLALILDFDSQ